ncbi:DUF262 domain-containing protein [Candidatus Igneacidithiobacillus taiwanensis]|uniref:DUF262 domain-containing protein n=1 Tax=Candidatus Igneacidithiobacillus taiwanensis TaxID=1945924 RepID=UPI002899603F|nr:DUF262 domain-containing protein [Candidatus Igneacidithiobacillus taiwanensis]
MQAVANTKSTKHTKILSIREIAWWWLGDSMKDYLRDDEGYVWADLPVIQRGFVWHANKIERLWDSIATGFPLGSLMLQKQKDSDPKTARKDGADSSVSLNRSKIRPGEEEQFFLLDGQQRATSIALGFKDVWSVPQAVTDDGWRTLWVDIGKVDLGDDRSFLFRVTSKSHPWGFSRSAEKSSVPTRLTADKMRSAHTFFKWAAGQLQSFEEYRSHFPENIETLKPYQVPPYLSLPWDCEAPVPLPLLMQVLMEVGSIDINRVKQGLLQRLQGLALWRIYRAKTEDASINLGLDKMERVDQILGGTDSDAGTAFEILINGLDSALSVAEIPAPVLDIDTVESEHNPSDSQSENKKDDNDPAFNLFERINTQGTALTAEDINYSMLKSAWPDAAEVIEDILRDKYLTNPTKMASILVRLVLLMDTNEKKREVTTGLNISQFRIAKRKYEESGKSLGERVKELASDAVNLLWETFVIKGEQASVNDWRLPSVLAVNLIRENDSLIIILILWLLYTEKYLRHRLDSEQYYRRALGFITAIAWFSPDKATCANIIGDNLIDIIQDGNAENREADLLNFFCRENYKQLLCHTKDRAAAWLPEPSEFNKLLLTYKKKKQKYFWHLYFEDVVEGGNSLINTFIEKQSKLNNKNVAYKLFENLIQNRRLLFYAQRVFVNNAFSWFDPTKIDRIEDHNVPWDLDHILPSNWFDNRSTYAPVPEYLKPWRNSNGNMRVWPAEANRSKGDDFVLEQDLQLPEYGLSYTNLLENCCIPGNSEFLILAKLRKNDFFANEFEANCDRFLQAAIHRTFFIYQLWYQNLDISSFCPTLTQDCDKMG